MRDPYRLLSAGSVEKAGCLLRQGHLTRNFFTDSEQNTSLTFEHPWPILVCS